MSLEPGQTLVRVDPGGEAWVLQETLGFFTSLEPSPDGRRLAYGKVTLEANAWMIEGF